MNRNTTSRPLIETQAILKDALNSFNARLDELPVGQKEAALEAFFSKIIKTAYDSHLSILVDSARAKIIRVDTLEAKSEAVVEFQAISEDLAQLCGL